MHIYTTSMILETDTPDWQIIVAIAILITIVLVWSWGLILENRYTAPYTLLAASSQQKWKRAAIIMFLRTFPFPIIVLVAPIIKLQSDHPRVHLLWTGIWILWFPAFVAIKRWNFERKLKGYQKLNKMIQLDINSKLNVFLRRFRLFMNAEMTRFLDEGYRDEDEADDKPAEDGWDIAGDGQ